VDSSFIVSGSSLAFFKIIKFPGIGFIMFYVIKIQFLPENILY